MELGTFHAKALRKWMCDGLIINYTHHIPENSGLAPILMRLPWPDTKLPKNFARPAPFPFAILFVRSQFRNCERQGVGRKGGLLR